MLLALTQIVARNLFDTGFPIAETLSRYLVLYVTLLGAVLAIDRRRHIKIDVACAWWPGLCARLEGVFYLLAAVVCAILTRAAVGFFRMEWEFATDSETWATLLALIFPIGWGLITLHFLLLALTALRRSDSA